MFVVYSVGCVVLLVRLVVGNRGVARMIRRANANPSFVVLANECRVLMGLRQTVPVLLSDEAASPMLVGVWRTSIVLPERIGQQLNRDELRSILVHELHHLQRHDAKVHFVEALLCVGQAG